MAKTSNNYVPVDKTIPIPANRYHKYPWRTIEVGDSFPYTVKTAFNTAYVAAKHASEAYAPKRYEAHKYKGGMRIWRVK